MYVPHFSTHVITVGLADSVASVLFPAFIAFGFIAAVVAMILIRGKRNKDEL